MVQDFVKRLFLDNDSRIRTDSIITSALLLVVTGFIYNFFFFVPISVNGKWIRAPRGSSVQDIIIKEAVILQSGDLRDTNGRLLKKEGGRAPGLFINGREVARSGIVSNGDRLTIRPGLDIIETVERKVEVLAPTTYVQGQGAFLSIDSTGQAGMKIVNIGATTGRVISEEIVRPAKPVILKRTKFTNDQVVALTFDDGPSPTFTPQILSILQGQQIPATFFVIGSQARKNPDILKQIMGAGCTVGNHSYSHAALADAPPAKICWELEKTEEVIRDATGVGSNWFRPPGGSTSLTVLEAASLEGCKTVLWSVDPLDWMSPSPQTIYDRVLSQVQPGSVILFHDGGGDRTATVQALPRIIEELKLRGYSIVNLDDLVGKE